MHQLGWARAWFASDRSHSSLLSGPVRLGYVVHIERKTLMHYRAISGLQRISEVFEAFVARYRALTEDNALQGFATAEAQWHDLATQGYLDN